jgi:hypothetical protein
MAPRKHEHGPPMDLANMRRQGVRHRIGTAKRIIIAVTSIACMATAAHAYEGSAYGGGVGSITRNAIDRYSDLIKSCRDGSDVTCLKRAYGEADKRLNEIYQGRFGYFGLRSTANQIMQPK